MTAAATATLDRDVYRFKMRDLCAQTGLDRQTIHFYIQQGLVPEGQKTGRNMAYYSEEHLERIRLVRSLSRERFLPLKAIRAILEGRDEAFSPEQRRLMAEVRTQVSSALRTGPEPKFVSVKAVCARHDVRHEDVASLVRAGLLGSRGEGDALELVEEDVWVVEFWARMRTAGFADAGFTPDDLSLFDDVMSRLVRREAALFASRLDGIETQQATALLDQGLPLINEFLTRMHTSRARQFLAAIE